MLPMIPRLDHRRPRMRPTPATVTPIRFRLLIGITEPAIWTGSALRSADPRPISRLGCRRALDRGAGPDAVAMEQAVECAVAAARLLGQRLSGGAVVVPLDDLGIGQLQRPTVASPAGSSHHPAQRPDDFENGRAGAFGSDPDGAAIQLFLDIE